MDTLETKKSQRFLFMNLLYEKTNGYRHAWVYMFELGEELGFTQDQTLSVVDYLGSENLVETKTGGEIFITHEGIVEVEAALSNREQPTPHFLPVNYIHVEHMSQSVIQQATHGSTQTVSFTQETLDDIQVFLQRLKNELPQLPLAEKDRRQVVGDIATMEAQLGTPRPNRDIIHAAGRVLHGILLGVGGNFATDLLDIIRNNDIMERAKPKQSQ